MRPGSGSGIQPGFCAVTWRAVNGPSTATLLSATAVVFIAKRGAVSRQQMASVRCLGVPKVRGRGAQRVTPGLRSAAANRLWYGEDRCPPAVLRGPGTAVPLRACHDAYSFLVARLPWGTSAPGEYLF